MVGSTQDQVEYRMRFQEILARMAVEKREAAPAERSLGPYVTISRQVGSRGREVARRVGERLGWSVMDRELVDDLADKLKLEPHLLALVDETRSGWFRDTLLNLMNPRLLLQDSYVSMISKIVLLAAYEGEVVVVGRGGNLILPGGNGVRVRIVAMTEHRVAWLCEDEGLDLESAVPSLKRRDASRSNFIKHHFHSEVDDPTRFDMMLNVSTVGVDGAAELICQAAESVRCRLVSQKNAIVR